jgi:hypothetical protein
VCPCLPPLSQWYFRQAGGCVTAADLGAVHLTVLSLQVNIDNLVTGLANSTLLHPQDHLLGVTVCQSEQYPRLLGRCATPQGQGNSSSD